MIDLRQVRKRVIRAVDSYIKYAPYMKPEGNDILIQRAETYRVNLANLTCTCHDYQFNGHLAPCKHLIMATIFQNALNHLSTEDMI